MKGESRFKKWQPEVKFSKTVNDAERLADFKEKEERAVPLEWPLTPEFRERMLSCRT